MEEVLQVRKLGRQEDFRLEGFFGCFLKGEVLVPFIGKEEGFAENSHQKSSEIQLITHLQPPMPICRKLSRNWKQHCVRNVMT